MHRIVHIDRIGQIEILNLLIQLGSIDRSAQFGHHVRHAAEIHGGRWCRGGSPRQRARGSGCPCGPISQYVVRLPFADVDVRVLVAARFRTAGTSTGRVWTCALPSRLVK